MNAMRTLLINRRHGLGCGPFGFGVEGTVYREVSARREPADANLVGLQVKVFRLLSENAKCLPPSA